jgi:hypothetical protein
MQPVCARCLKLQPFKRNIRVLEDSIEEAIEASFSQRRVVVIDLCRGGAQEPVNVQSVTTGHGQPQQWRLAVRNVTFQLVLEIVDQSCGCCKGLEKYCVSLSAYLEGNGEWYGHDLSWWALTDEPSPVPVEVQAWGYLVGPVDRFPHRIFSQILRGALQGRFERFLFSFFRRFSFAQCVLYLRQIVTIQSRFRLVLHVWNGAMIHGVTPSVRNGWGWHVISRTVGMPGVSDMRRMQVVVAPMAHQEFGETWRSNVRDIAIAVAAFRQREHSAKGHGGYTFHTDCGDAGEGPCLYVVGEGSCSKWLWVVVNLRRYHGRRVQGGFCCTPAH